MPLAWCTSVLDSAGTPAEVTRLVRSTRRASTRPAIARAAVAAIAGGALLTGCAVGPGMAVKAGDASVTEDEVSSATLQYQEITGSPTGLAQVATVLAQADAVSGVMADAGVTVTDNEVVQTLEENGLTIPDEGLSDGSTKLWRSLLEYEEAGTLDPAVQAQIQEALAQRLEETPVTLNPRYAVDEQGNPLLPTWIDGQPRGAAAVPAEVPAG